MARPSINEVKHTPTETESAVGGGSPGIQSILKDKLNPKWQDEKGENLGKNTEQIVW